MNMDNGVSILVHIYIYIYNKILRLYFNITFGYFDVMLNQFNNKSIILFSF